MSTTLRLECACGRLRGQVHDVGPGSGNHAICFCDDCQAYAHFLGHPERVLDASGGTQVFQLTPAQLELTEGLDQLRCMRLSEKGLLRWYAGCCNVPIANTLPWPRVPFAGIIVARLGSQQGESAVAEALGPVRASVHARFAKPPLPANARRSMPLGLMARTLRLLAIAALRGKHAPSPFFTTTGELRVEPSVLPASERQVLRQRVAA